jgi:SAM-dependent methyltransferase
MRTEGIDVLEEWFRWAEEWSMLLRMYGRIAPASKVLEIGCGLGRVAFALRYILTRGSYEGFDIAKDKVDFLAGSFHARFPNFTFSWADISNTYYNPSGKIRPSNYEFPYPDAHFDIVFAASVFTHMLPENTARYFMETSRVLNRGGRCLFSFFILDNYRPGAKRPLGFNRSSFDFDYRLEPYGDDFALANPDNPEEMTAYRASLLEHFAHRAGLSLVERPLPGLWSGSFDHWVGAQDLLVLSKG